MKPALTYLLALSFAAAPLAHAGAAAELKQDLKEAAADTKQLAHETKEEFQKRMEALRADSDVKIAELDKKVEALDKKARKAANKQIKALKQQRKNFDKKLAKLKASSADRWEKVKDGVDKAGQDLKSAFDHVAESFKN